VLKVVCRHTEAAHEADGLREWDGDGAVRLYAVQEFDDTVALLLERCVPGTTLTSRPEPEQDMVIAGLLPRLWREPAPGQRFRPLQVMCDEWAAEFERKAADERATLDPGLAREGIKLFRTLPATAARHVLLCTDLHAGNVLAAEREPWLLIDPKPYFGDPTYDVLQHILNCDDRLRADPRALARRMADLLDLDAERVLLWLFARCVQESPDSGSRRDRVPDRATVAGPSARLVAIAHLTDDGHGHRCPAEPCGRPRPRSNRAGPASRTSLARHGHLAPPAPHRMRSGRSTDPRLVSALGADGSPIRSSLAITHGA
jgi:streptomycin 6-kinase